jgi:hypothetical protein
MFKIGERVKIMGDILECVSIDLTRDYYTEDKVNLYGNTTDYYKVIAGGSYNNETWYIITRGNNIVFIVAEDNLIPALESTEPTRDTTRKYFDSYIGKKGVVRERTDIYDEEIISGTCVDYKYNSTDGFLLYIQNDENEVYFVKPEHFILKSSKKMYDLYQELLEKCDKLTDASIHYGHVIGNLQNQLCKTSDYIKQEELTTKIKEFKKKQAKTWDKKDFIKRYMRRIEIITNMKGNK